MIIIGERVNATRRAVREAIQGRDEEAIRKEIARQVDAGADYIDLNAGTGSGDMDQEKNDLCWLVDCALACTDKKLTLDAADISVIAHAANHLAGRREWMLNSVNADSKERLAHGLSLAGEHGVPVIALAMDEDGIPPEAQKRLEICEQMHEVALSKGVKTSNLFFDPLVLPVSADTKQPNVTFEVLRGIHERFPEAKTTMGLSNVSHGLSKRARVNSAFLTIAIGMGLDSAICDPSRPSIIQAILTADMLMGKDRYCRKFSRAVRKGVFDTKK